ncbi:conserved hypothetical protein [Ricinus communis]|uniref:Uncharacterized protein n=1 Tax=Ricinus communis TaxID=3988 RepID=B9RSG4_RICCO|nr:conserved hypothetical protein [Ricinus communis]
MYMLGYVRNRLISAYVEAELIVEHEGENLSTGNEAGDAHVRNEEIIRDDNMVEASVVGGVMEGAKYNATIQLDEYIPVDKSDTNDRLEN